MIGSWITVLESPYILYEYSIHQHRIHRWLEIFDFDKGEELKLNFNRSSEILWTCPSQELIYKGKHYDVKSTINDSSGVHVICIADNKEDELDAKYTDLKNNQRDIQWKLLTFKLDVIHPGTINEHLVIIKIKKDNIIYKSVFWKFPFTDKYSPPPET